MASLDLSPSSTTSERISGRPSAVYPQRQLVNDFPVQGMERSDTGLHELFADGRVGMIILKLTSQLPDGVVNRSIVRPLTFRPIQIRGVLREKKHSVDCRQEPSKF